MHGIKAVNVFFNEKEHEELKKLKGRNRSWHDFFCILLDKNNQSTS